MPYHRKTYKCKSILANMPKQIFIGIIGDFHPEYSLHIDTNTAFSQIAKRLGTKINLEWIPTSSLNDHVQKKLDRFDAFLCAPGSPYKSMVGALNGIKFAREADRPFLGTCGGFQHAVIEYARNVMGVKDADHAEEHPDAPRLFITRLSCSLAGKTQKIHITPGSRAHAVYGALNTEERFFCSFGLNPAIRGEIEDAGLRASGFDDNGEVRIMELPKARFFFATLFVPQACPLENKPHPLVTALVDAAKK
jgi:CTP synthase (UTP-ammonia lyase)